MEHEGQSFVPPESPYHNNKKSRENSCNCDQGDDQQCSQIWSPAQFDRYLNFCTALVAPAHQINVFRTGTKSVYWHSEESRIARACMFTLATHQNTFWSMIFPLAIFLFSFTSGVEVFFRHKINIHACVWFGAGISHLIGVMICIRPAIDFYLVIIVQDNLGLVECGVRVNPAGIS